jgi:hypothetical protein
MTIRIPTIDTTSVQSRGLPTAAPVLTQANTSFAGAVEQAGQMLGRQEDIYRQRMEQARARADALVEARGLTALQAGTNSILRGDSAADGTRTPGYLETQGEAASAASRDAIDRATKQRDDIAKGMNARQKERFLARSDGVLLSFNNTVESHAGQQFKVAQKAAALGLQAETLKAIESNPGDLTLPIRMAQVERTTRELQLSPEDGDADVSRFKAAAAVAQINGLLASGDVAGAKRVLTEKHDDLGVMRDEATFKIERKENAGRVQREQTENETVVSGIMGKARRPDGRIDEGKALAEFDNVPPERFTEVRRLAEARLQLERRKDKYLDGQRRLTAREQFIKNGGLSGIDPQVVADLQHYDGEFYGRLKREQDLQNRRARAGKGGAKAQAAVDRIAMWQYRAALIDDPDTEPGDFAMGKGVSPEAMAHMQFNYQQTQKKAGREESRELKSFVDQVERLTPELKAKGKAKPVFGQTDDRELLRGRAAEAYAKWVETHKGQQPSPAEVEQMQNELVKEVITEVPGRFFGTNTVKQPAFRVPQASTPTQTPPVTGEKIRVRLKSNGKTGNIAADKFNAATMERL